MKKVYLLLIAVFPFCFTGCGVIGNEDTGISLIYGLCSVVSFITLIVYCCLPKDRNKWFLALFLSVLVVNVGYYLLSCSNTLSWALIANRISYFGSVFLPMAMFMIIMNVTNIRYKKWLPIFLFALGIVVFLIAASPGYSTIYYKEVHFEIVDGVAVLNKVYGPLHIMYLFYLVGYFVCMIAGIVQSFVKKTADSILYSVIVAVAVFINLCVWFLEQFMNNSFEFLSVSYIISELFLLGLTFIIREHEKLKAMVKVKGIVNNMSPESIGPLVPVIDVDTIDIERMDHFVSGYEQLTKTEKEVFKGYTNRLTTKEIMVVLNITENTLKFHNKNLYGKLGVSSRKELMKIYEQVKTVKGTFEQ